MRKPTFRVIFDRSAFQGAAFELLVNSPLRELCKRGVLHVFHTEIFLEETLQSYGSRRAGDAWRQELIFAMEICSGGLFLDRDEIWHNELIVGRGPFARYLVPERRSRRYRRSRSDLMSMLRAAAESGDLSEEWRASAQERAITQAKKDNQRAISSEMRHKVIEGLRDKRVTGGVAAYPFEQFRRTAYERTGRHLMDLVDKARASRLADQWAKRPARYPYYSAFVEGFLYNGYYAAVEHSEALDRNAQPDYEQLAYLTWADLIVSDDQSFFRRAFETLWKPRGKRLESSSEFVALLNRLA
jgi:hypothetical protein